jgi:hypothetical protein
MGPLSSPVHSTWNPASAGKCWSMVNINLNKVSNSSKAIDSVPSKMTTRWVQSSHWGHQIRGKRKERVSVSGPATLACRSPNTVIYGPCLVISLLWLNAFEQRELRKPTPVQEWNLTNKQLRVCFPSPFCLKKTTTILFLSLS